MSAFLAALIPKSSSSLKHDQILKASILCNLTSSFYFNNYKPNTVFCVHCLLYNPKKNVVLYCCSYVYHMQKTTKHSAKNYNICNKPCESEFVCERERDREEHLQQDLFDFELELTQTIGQRCKQHKRLKLEEVMILP